MIGALGPLVLALALGAPIESTALKSEYWVSHIGLFRVKVPRSWQMAVRAAGEGMLEDLRVGPKKEPTVSITILSRRFDRPMTSIDCDDHVRGLLKKYKKEFQDVAVRQGPARVPVGNEDSWGYLLIYNTKATDGSKVSVHETVNYVNRRLGDRAYMHHVIVGRVPLPVAYTFSLVASKFMNEIVFQKAEKQALPGTTTASPAPDGEDEEVEEETPAPSASPSPAPAPKSKEKKAKVDPE